LPSTRTSRAILDGAVAYLSNINAKQLEISSDTSIRILYYGGGEAQEQVSQRSCGCPIPGSVQGQVVWGFEQLGLVQLVPAHGQGIGTG